MKKNILCAIALGSTMEELVRNTIIAQKEADFVEVRVDYIQDVNNINLQIVKNTINNSSILTCRRLDEGGKWVGSESDRLQILEKACQLGFSYVDIELKTLEEGFVIPSNRNTRIIVSHHNFNKTPTFGELNILSIRMEKYNPDIKKIATFITAEENSEILYKFLTHKKGGERISVIGMGKLGKQTRILSPLLGGSFTYCSISSEKKSAPGQMTCKEMKKIYELLE